MAEQDFRVQKGIVVADGDVTVPSDHSVFAGTFDTNVAAAAVTLAGTTLAADGTDNDIDINLTPKGTGEVNITKVDINAGAIDGTVIGAGTPAAGTFAALTATSLNMSEGNITNAGVLSVDRIGVDDSAVGLSLDFSNANNTKGTIKLKDNVADALNILEDTNSYMKFVTTDSSEQVVFGKGVSYGADGSGVDVTFYSATAGDKMWWDASEEQLVIMGTDGATALNVADGNVTVSDTLTATNIGAFTAVGAIDFGNNPMSNVDINSGAIDGTVIGANSAVAGTFAALQGTSILGTSHGRIGGTAREGTTRFQVNGVVKTGGSNGSTISYTEGRLHSDISNDDIAGTWNGYYGMSNAFILDNAENNAGSGQSIVFTEGRSGTSGNGSSFSIGRQLGGHNTAGDAKFQIGFASHSYEAVGYANGAGNDHHEQNPALSVMSLLEIDISGNVQLTKGRGSASEGKLIFSGEASDGTDHTISLKAPHNTMTANQNYTLPVAPAGSNGFVLSSTTAGVMSWVAQSGGIGSSLSSTDNRIVRMDGTDDVQGSTATIDDSGNMTVAGTLTATNITGNSSMVVTSDTDAEFVALTLTNQSDSANTNGFVSQLFNLEDTGGNAVDAGKIAVKKEGSFTATANSQDSKMTFSTSQDGTLSEKMAIASNGYITVTHGMSLGTDLTVGDDIILNSDDAAIRPAINYGSNLDGHTLFIKGGQGTGNGASGDIIFHTKTSNGSGATGLHNMGAAMTLSGGNVTIHGDLTVNGTNTVLNTDELQVEDHVITLNYSGSDSSSSADGAGFIIQDAVDASNDASLTWNASNDDWQLSHTLDVAGSVTATGSFVIGSASMNETDLEKLDGITNGTAVANKALVVDGSKDIGTLGTVTAANLTATTAFTTPSISIDSVAVIDSSTANGASFSGSAVDLASYAFATYRTVKFAGQIVNDSTHETDAFEILVTYDGASGPSATSDVHMTTYAYISSNDTPMGTFAAVKSGSNIVLQFTNTVSNFTGSYALTATQLIKT